MMVRWAWGVAAAAVALTRLESERQYERCAGSAAVAITRWRVSGSRSDVRDRQRWYQPLLLRARKDRRSDQ